MTDLSTPRPRVQHRRGRDALPWKPVARMDQWTDTGALLAGEDPDLTIIHAGNMLLDLGVGDLLDRAFGLGGQPFSAATCRLGVGNGDAAEAPDQTGLLGGSQLYKTMEPGYPARNNRTVSLRAAYGPTEANWEWTEWVADNGAGGGPGHALSRKLAIWGLKPSGSTRFLTISYTA